MLSLIWYRLIIDYFNFCAHLKTCIFMFPMSALRGLGESALTFKALARNIQSVPWLVNQSRFKILAWSFENVMQWTWFPTWMATMLFKTQDFVFGWGGDTFGNWCLIKLESLVSEYYYYYVRTNIKNKRQ